MGAKAYSHEEMRKLDLFCCCMCRNLVVIDEMVDVERGSILFEGYKHVCEMWLS